MQTNYDNNQVQEAELFSRFLAWVVDASLLGLVGAMMSGATFVMMLFMDGDYWTSIIISTLAAAFVSLLGVLYRSITTYYWGATLGKKFMKLEVVSLTSDTLTWLQIIYRESVGKYLSKVLLGIGYLMILLKKDRQALHDYLCDTMVIKKREAVITEVNGDDLQDGIEKVEDVHSDVDSKEAIIVPENAVEEEHFEPQEEFELETEAKEVMFETEQE